MSTNPEPVPGPGTECRLVLEAWLGPLQGAHALVGILGSRKNSDESSLVYQERLHRRKRDEGEGIESQWDIVKGRG